MTNSSKPDICREQFMDLFLQDTPLMDVRAPTEYKAGAFPSASNVPLLDDQQRHLIGTEYAEHGQDAAITLGKTLATSTVKASRLELWQRFVAENPSGCLYCFRGGLRSQITQRWLAESGIQYSLVKGGYKALRQFLLEQLVSLCKQDKIILLSGATGVGKTEILQNHACAIDLEGRARHRGSAFGTTFQDQPAQIDWENQIIIDWLRSDNHYGSPVLVEAESHLIGRIHLPFILQEAMARAPVVEVHASLEERTERLYADYVLHSLAHFRMTSETPWVALHDHVLQNLKKIRKRLGGLQFQILSAQLVDAINELRHQNDPSVFQNMIKTLLTEYYDPLYHYHQKKNRARVETRGSALEVRHWFDQSVRQLPGRTNFNQVVSS